MTTYTGNDNYGKPHAVAPAFATGIVREFRALLIIGRLGCNHSLSHVIGQEFSLVKVRPTIAPFSFGFIHISPNAVVTRAI